MRAEVSAVHSACMAASAQIGLEWSGKPKPMAPRFLTILTGRTCPEIRQPREPEPSTINEKTVADFTRVVEQMGILERKPRTDKRASPPRDGCPALKVG